MDNISISLQEGSLKEVSEIRVDGVIDTLTAGDLEEVLDSLLKRERYNVVVDLAGVDYISSAGWGIFISHIKEVRANGGDIKLANMISNVYEIYELLEFDNVLTAYTSIDEARDAFEAQLPADEKKKAQKLTRVTVLDTDTKSRSTLSAQSPPTRTSYPPDLETAIIRIVEQDPFASIREIKTEINHRPGNLSTTWWQVFSVLRQRKLLTKRSRFRYILGRR